MNQRVLHDLKEALVADKNKSVTLAALLVILTGLGVKHLASRGPSNALASDALEAPLDESSGISGAGQRAVSRALASAQLSPDQEVISVPRPQRISRDLFAIEAEQFPLSAQPEPSVVPSEGSQSTHVESIERNADEQRARVEAQLIAETAGWRLRSILMGPSPSVVVEVDGAGARRAVMRVGQALRSWTLVQIDASSAVFERDGLRVRVSLASPE